VDTSFPLLTSIILVPAAGALVVALLPKDQVRLVKLVGILFALATAALTIYLLIDFDKSVPGGPHRRAVPAGVLGR